jgi:chemotaxis protein CheD
MDEQPGQVDIFLQPGELFVGDSGWRMRTLLGSCVSITLWHPASRMGGMSHFLLPTRGRPRLLGQGPDGRYGDEALEAILSEIRAAGVRPEHCQGKIFGGGNMFPGQPCPGVVQVGQRNGVAAREMLLEHGIPLVGESLFGFGHRQIIFDVGTGDVWSCQVAPGSLEAEADTHGLAVWS